MAYLAGSYVLFVTALVCWTVWDWLAEREHQKHLEHVWGDHEDTQKHETTQHELARPAGHAKSEGW